jgi:hypothetical protein
VNAEAALAVEASAAMSPKTSENFIFLNWGFFFCQWKMGELLALICAFGTTGTKPIIQMETFTSCKMGSRPTFIFLFLFFSLFYFLVFFVFFRPPRSRRQFCDGGGADRADNAPKLGIGER